jgi:MraZ protein
MDKMFRGNHITRVDEKGRLKLPAEFKRQIDEEYGGNFYITSRDGKVAEIHPMREWEKYEEKLAQMPSSHPAKKKLLKRLNFFGQTAEMHGSEWHLEVSNREDYEREMAEVPMTVDDEMELSKFGL